MRLMVLDKKKTARAGIKGSPNQAYAIYASRFMTDIYHLVQPGGNLTLCGLRISRVTSGRKANLLQLIDDLSSHLTMCKHCERIQGQEHNEAEI